MRRLWFLSIAVVLALTLRAHAQQPTRTACDEVRDGLAQQIAQQATILTEQQRRIGELQKQVADLTPKKPEEKK